MSNEEREKVKKKKADYKLKKIQLLAVILIGLVALITGTSVLLQYNFNIIGQFKDGGYAIDVYVSGSYAYVTKDFDGLGIIDISDPTAPVEVGQFNDGGYANSIHVSGSYAYVVGWRCTWSLCFGVVCLCGGW